MTVIGAVERRASPRQPSPIESSSCDTLRTRRATEATSVVDDEADKKAMRRRASLDSAKRLSSYRGDIVEQSHRRAGGEIGLATIIASGA